jgi:hypothetical protein
MVITPCGGTPATGASLLTTMVAAGAIAVWKLNEASGTVATDATGDGWDLSAAPNPPTWGQSAGPPGTTSAQFLSDYTKRLYLAGFPALGLAGAPFTVGGWLNYTDADQADVYSLVGQGVNVFGTFGLGWGLSVQGGHLINPRKLELYTNDGTNAGPERFASNSALTAATWYFVAIAWTGAAWKMYVNGVLQAGTDSRAWTPQTGIYLASPLGTLAGSVFHFDGLMSWWCVVPGAALTSAQLLAIMASV